MSEAGGPPEPYPLRGGDELARWKEECTPADHHYHRVRFFIRRLMVDPGSVPALKEQTTGLPEFTYVVPGTDALVSWVVIPSPPYAPEQRGVLLVDVRPVTV